MCFWQGKDCISERLTQHVRAASPSFILIDLILLHYFKFSIFVEILLNNGQQSFNVDFDWNCKNYWTDPFQMQWTKTFGYKIQHIIGYILLMILYFTKNVQFNDPNTAPEVNWFVFLLEILRGSSLITLLGRSIFALLLSLKF